MNMKSISKKGKLTLILIVVVIIVGIITATQLIGKGASGQQFEKTIIAWRTIFVRT